MRYDTAMTTDERLRAAARIDANLAKARAQLAEYDAREPERLRLRIKSELAVEQLHEAVVALKAARAQLR
jgi:hypothetical protein